MTATTSGDRTTVRISDTTERGDLVAAVADDCTALEVGSTGRHALEPLVLVTHGGRTGVYSRCSPAEVERITAACLDGPDVAAADPTAVVEHDPDADALSGLGEDGETRELLGACGWRRPTSVEDHEAAGGFSGADRDAVFSVGGQLTGRGWSDWCHDEPLAESWETVESAAGAGAVVVNGHGSRADALLLSSAPFEVLDGANALATALDAGRIVVYASEADERALDVAREAAGAYPDPAAPIDVVAGKPVYRAGEPTMAIEDVEGNHRLEARLRPPGPETFGLDGQPTAVHTPRTLAHLAAGLREGLPGTRLVSVEGDVDAPATVELPESGTLAGAIEAVDLDDGFKAASVGGRFGGLTDSLAVGVDPDSLSGAGLGTDGVVHVLSEGRCVLEFVGKRAAFAADSNCGRCVPCREGTTQLAELLRDVYGGEYDPAKIEELTQVMASTSICEFGAAAARPARTALSEFGAELRAHAEGQCPEGACLEPMEATQ